MSKTLPAFFPLFFKFPKNKDEWGHDELPLFPPNMDSPESVRLHVVCMCVCPNSWAGLTEPEHHGWLLIIHPNNPYIT